MVFRFLRSPKQKTWLVSALIIGSQLLNAQTLRVPAFIFPNDNSDLITYIKVDPSKVVAFPKVLDSGLDGEWYWTTYTGDFVGYVNKREVVSKNQLKNGTLIRTNPTVHSWVLTKYERGDTVHVRSRLSVGRVSFSKEIPVYFQIPDAELATMAEMPAEPPVSEEIETPQIAAVEEHEVTKTVKAPVVDEIAQMDAPTQIEEDSAISADIPAHSPPLLAAIPEMAEPVKQKPVDPLLEEAPRIPAQDLANLAPPPSDLYQEFEGYLRLVTAADPFSKDFQYQLETRSGQRIVYVKLLNLRGGSYEDYVDQWINIRGSLDEIGKDFTLFIDAYSIWVAPEE